MNLEKYLNRYWTVILAAILGFVVVVAPPYILKSDDFTNYDAPLLPFVRTAIENLQILPTAIMLVAAGALFGFAFTRWCFVLALSTMLFFPVIVMIELIIDPASHGLWPFEVLTYVALTIPVILGAAIGRYFARHEVK